METRWESDDKDIQDENPLQPIYFASYHPHTHNIEVMDSVLDRFEGLETGKDDRKDERDTIPTALEVWNLKVNNNDC